MHDGGGGFSGGHHGGDFGGHHGGHSGVGADAHHRHHVAGAGDPADLGDFARRVGPRGRRGRVSRRAWQVYRLVLWAFIIGVILWATLH